MALHRWRSPLSVRGTSVEATYHARPPAPSGPSAAPGSMNSYTAGRGNVFSSCEVFEVCFHAAAESAGVRTAMRWVAKRSVSSPSGNASRSSVRSVAMKAAGSGSSAM